MITFKRPLGPAILAGLLVTLALPTLQAVDAGDVPFPFPDPVDPQAVLGDPTLTPKPSLSSVVLPLPEWDESLVQNMVNRGNPFTDYWHYRIRSGAFSESFALTGGHNLPLIYDGWGAAPLEMSKAEQDAAYALFDPPQDWKDGSKVKYSLLRPPSGESPPAAGWPLYLSIPGQGGIGRDDFYNGSSYASELILASDYFRTHFPTYHMVVHPQSRTVDYPDNSSSEGTEVLFELIALVESLLADDSYNIDPNRIYAYGHSHGGTTTLNLIRYAPELMAAGYAAAGRPPDDPVAAAAMKDTPIWLVQSHNDPWQGSARFLSMYQLLLQAGATRVRFWETQNLGHSSQQKHLMHGLQWLYQQSKSDPIPGEAPQLGIEESAITVTEGQAVSLRGYFTTLPLPDFQWERQNDGLWNPITDATSPQLQLAAATLTDSGSYRLRGTNSVGSNTSDTITLTVEADVTPAHITGATVVTANRLAIRWSEPIEAGQGAQGAENTANYQIQVAEISIHEAFLAAPDMVVLRLDSLPASGFDIAVDPINDRARLPNQSAPTAVSISADELQLGQLFQIDFGDQGTPSGETWQQLNSHGTLTNMRDFNSGDTTSAALTLAVGSGLGAQALATSGQWGGRLVAPPWADDAALSDALLINFPDHITITISGLVPGAAYDLDLASSLQAEADDASSLLLIDAGGAHNAINAYTDDSLADEFSNRSLWFTRATADGGRGSEGWIRWQDAIADDQGSLTLTVEAGPHVTNPSAALNALRIHGKDTSLIAPTAPQGLQAAAFSSAGIHLTWGEIIATTEGISIERAAAAGGPWTSVALVAGDATEFYDSGLTEESTYWYRLRAFNLAGEGNASDAVSATTPGPPDSPWSHQMAIAISGYHGDTTLQNFPLLVRLSEDLTGFSYADFADPNGGDLRFTSDDGSQELSFEIDHWNPQGESTIWVRIPEILGSRTVIRAFWGNDQATTPPAYTLDGSVWTGIYDGVWHLNEAAGTDRLDATAANNHAAPSGEVQQAAGIIGQAAEFDGGNGTTQLRAGSDLAAAHTFSDSFTMEAWVKLRGDRDREYWQLFSQNNTYQNGGGYLLQINNESNIRASIGTELGTGGGSARQTLDGDFGGLYPDFPAIGWFHVSATWDGTTGRIFVNGTQLVESGSLNKPIDLDTGRPLVLGAGWWGDGAQQNRSLDGWLDEARVSAQAQSPDWVRATYHSAVVASDFLDYGEVILNDGPRRRIRLFHQADGAVWQLDGDDTGVSISDDAESRFFDQLDPSSDYQFIIEPVAPDGNF